MAKTKAAKASGPCGVRPPTPSTAPVACPSTPLPQPAPSTPLPELAPSTPLPEQPEEPSRKRKNPRPSLITPYFKAIGSTKQYPEGALRCLECQRLKVIFDLSDQKGSTSHLHKHFKAKHLALYVELFPDEKDATLQPTIRAFAVNGTSVGFNLDDFYDLLIRWVVYEDIPFRALESTHLQNVMSYLNHRAVLPHHVTVSRKIDAMYNRLQPQVRALLHAVTSKLSATTDLWTSPNKHAFSCVTIHWIDDNWTLRSCILGFEPVIGSYTSEAIYTSFAGLLASKEWELDMDCIFGVTLDNAKTNIKFLDLLHARRRFDTRNGFRCLAHVLNIVCQTLLEHKEVKDAAERVRAIGRYVAQNGSAQRMQQWLHICKKHLRLDCPTRWSSTRDMLSLAVEMRDLIPIWRTELKDPKDRANTEITDAGWEKVELVLELLEPFAKATNLATQDSQPISFVLPLYNTVYYDLKKKLEHPKFASFYDAMHAALAKIEEYYKLTTEVLSVATVLDPRANMYFFTTHAVRCGYISAADAQDSLTSELGPYLSGPVVVREETPVEDDMLGICQGGTNPHDEFALYSREMQQPRDQNPLDWWKCNHKKYPGLAKAARDHLAARCTSAPSERAFSLGRQLVSEFRRQLSADTIKKCMLIQSWMDLIK